MSLIKLQLLIDKSLVKMYQDEICKDPEFIGANKAKDQSKLNVISSDDFAMVNANCEGAKMYHLPEMSAIWAKMVW